LLTFAGVAIVAAGAALALHVIARRLELNQIIVEFHIGEAVRRLDARPDGRIVAAIEDAFFAQPGLEANCSALPYRFLRQLVRNPGSTRGGCRGRRGSDLVWSSRGRLRLICGCLCPSL